MRKKRIMWLLNHDTLSKFELPLIRDLGYEIFTPKIAIKEVFQSSGSVTYNYDKTLSIPIEDLNQLNEYDFFTHTNNMPLNIKKIINTHFATAITYTDTTFAILRKLIYNFDGDIFFRAFGLGPLPFQNYTQLIDYYFEESEKYKLKQISNRFWFSQCYANISEIEHEFYKERTVFMPLGLPSEFYNIKDEWYGSEEKILFFCTRIKHAPASEQVYREFKKDFKGFDYIVAGNQPVPVDDDKVVGFLEREELNELFKKCKAMYYHSTDPRHLHYHPLEAMIAGMPVIYMDGGLLSILGKGKRQSGCCKDIKEARIKIQRVFSGDTQLIEDIKQDQQGILYNFSYEYNKLMWENNFIPIIEDSNKWLDKSYIRSKSIAIFNSESHSGKHYLDYSKMVDIINESIKQVNPLNRVIFNNQYDEMNREQYPLQCSTENIDLREYTLKTISSLETSGSLELMFVHEPIWHSQYVIPVDHAQNFVDADYWLFLDDSIDSPIAPIKPYGFFVETLADRFYGALSDKRIYNLKNASFILTSSKTTKIDLVKYLGIDEKLIFVIPFLFSTPKKSERLSLNEDYSLIEADLNKRTELEVLIKNISDYYSLYQDNQKIKVCLSNFSEKRDQEYVDNIMKGIMKTDYLKNNITLHVDVGVNEYNALYAHALRIIIPHHIRGVFFKFAKAMQFSKKMIVNNYPFYKDFEEIFGNNVQYVKFLKQGHALMKLLSDFSQVETAKNDIHDIKSTDITEISELWRKIL
ncbi:glycosyltransferase [Paenibacillus popilliae]|uniref:Glycosyltransferase n=1 Tax=Paenibacillus popilliae ATCC 14706 TaxID=1212764 RepID=M9LMW8_PAEPP|nr:glycosyltransferase [Paenibacillus popilliae]GAC41576.1 hypothetical protein PPOP_0927 [Paenibacillus popilliae ATCC 14706]